MHRRGFTLLELLIVIAILAALATIAVLVINPIEYMRQSRDAKRIGDITTLNKALAMAEFNGLNMGGAPTTIFVSLVDTVANCANLGLPALPEGYAYRCVTSAADLRKTNGAGWIPINLGGITGGTPLPALPTDPINDANNFYTYVPGGSFALSAKLESEKMIRQNGSNDGGINPAKFEAGSDIALLASAESLVGYWPFEEGSGSVVNDMSGMGGVGTWQGTGAHYGAAKVGVFAAQFDGTSDYIILPRFNYSEISVVGWFNRGAKDGVNADTGLGGWYWNADGQLRQGFDAMRFYINSDAIEWMVETRNGANVVTEKSASYNLGAASTGQWHHFAGTYNAATGVQKLYIDGVLRSTQNHPAGNTIVQQATYADIRIGHSRVNNGYFNGALDDMRIYMRPLSDREVEDIYSATK